MRILVTGAAGFIGYFVCKSLLEKGHTVIGLDNINDYYDPNLKFDRLKQLGIKKESATPFNNLAKSDSFQNFSFIRLNLEDREELKNLFSTNDFEVVCNLAAQAGVRYSLENPEAYVDSNIVGFLNILENCRHNNIEHLVYASSSSVYGLNSKIPFSTTDRTDNPISLYAASKKSNELMAHTYSHLFELNTTGLRFFTVYGPWGRPDMAMFLFVDAIKNGKPINVFNHGKLARDFTYVDDIVAGVVKIVEKPILEGSREGNRSKLYNIGNNKQVKLTEFIDAIEKALNTEAKKNMMPMQPGDVEVTWANVTDLIEDYDYKPNTPIENGVFEFVKWYESYYSK